MGRYFSEEERTHLDSYTGEVLGIIGKNAKWHRSDLLL
jgi:hypothetical protein